MSVDGQNHAPSYEPPTYPGYATSGAPIYGPAPTWNDQYGIVPAGSGGKRGGSRRRWPLVAGLAAAAVIGGGVFGVNAYAKHKACSALENSQIASAGSDTGSKADGFGETAQMRKVADQFRTYSRLLVIDRSLGTAMDGLAEDVDQLADMSEQAKSGDIGFEAIGQMLSLAGSVETHARQAQRACGLPVTGLSAS